MRKLLFLTFILIPFIALLSKEKVDTGLDRFFRDGYDAHIKGKTIGIVTNHASLDKNFRSSVQIFKEHEKDNYTIKALFAPEHGFYGVGYAAEKIKDAIGPYKLPINSLHGAVRRPTAKMLEGIEVLIYDLQHTGCRAYTYETTLFYIMEEAAKKNIEVIVLDRPNPIGGIVVDGPLLKDNCKSFIGYINVPYCHGFTIGELARFFNEEYKVNCKLTVVPMKGWRRDLSFNDTDLVWMPISPNVPEGDTPLFTAMTGILGEIGIVNIGIGYTMPFKLIGAPWIKADELAEKLNAQNLPGVLFLPFHYRPFYGLYKGIDCHGIRISVTDSNKIRPLAVQYLIMGILKALYPKQFEQTLAAVDPSRLNLFCSANGNKEMLEIIKNDRYIGWKLIQFDKEERKNFQNLRKKYLIYK